MRAPYRRYGFGLLFKVRGFASDSGGASTAAGDSNESVFAALGVGLVCMCAAFLLWGATLVVANVYAVTRKAWRRRGAAGAGDDRSRARVNRERLGRRRGVLAAKRRVHGEAGAGELELSGRDTTTRGVASDEQRKTLSLSVPDYQRAAFGTVTRGAARHRGRERRVRGRGGRTRGGGRAAGARGHTQRYLGGGSGCGAAHVTSGLDTSTVVVASPGTSGDDAHLLVTARRNPLFARSPQANGGAEFNDRGKGGDDASPPTSSHVHRNPLFATTRSPEGAARM